MAVRNDTNYFADSSPIEELAFPVSGASASSKLEGQILSSSSSHAAASSDDGLNTLDEPVLTTIKRDFLAVVEKFKHVLIPQKSQALLKDWDLWGPLFLCVFLALFLRSSQDSEHELGPQFTEVFAITWFGACLVTLNIKLLRGTISFFQTLCVLGYCLLPLVVSLIISKVVISVSSANTFQFIARFILAVGGFLWATFASNAFLSGHYPQNRKFLAIYPIFLFYFVISWMILSQA